MPNQVNLRQVTMNRRELIFIFSVGESAPELEEKSTLLEYRPPPPPPLNGPFPIVSPCEKEAKKGVGMYIFLIYILLTGHPGCGTIIYCGEATLPPKLLIPKLLI